MMCTATHEVVLRRAAAVPFSCSTSKRVQHRGKPVRLTRMREDDSVESGFGFCPYTAEPKSELRRP